MGEQISDSLSNNVRALFVALNKTLDEDASSQVDISILQVIHVKISVSLFRPVVRYVCYISKVPNILIPVDCSIEESP